MELLQTNCYLTDPCDLIETFNFLHLLIKTKLSQWGPPLLYISLKKFKTKLTMQTEKQILTELGVQ
jgi:hypothetical protein